MEILPNVQGQLTLQTLVRPMPNFRTLAVLVTCKNEEDSIKNGGARVLTKFYPL